MDFQRWTRVTVLATVIATVTMAPGYAESPDVRNIVPNVTEPPNLRHTAPTGFLLVEEGLWAQHNDQPASEFEAARDSLLQDNPIAAAAAIRRAAAYVRAEGSRADATFRPRLQAVSQELDTLAGNLGGKPDLNADPLSPVFARAQRVLALHHLTLARESANEDDARRAGQRLATATLNVRNALAWADRPLDKGTAENLDRVDALAAALQEDGAVIGPEVDSALKDLEQALAL